VSKGLLVVHSMRRIIDLHDPGFVWPRLERYELPPNGRRCPVCGFITLLVGNTEEWICTQNEIRAGGTCTWSLKAERKPAS
jgi:hypothetical protein